MYTYKMSAKLYHSIKTTRNSKGEIIGVISHAEVLKYINTSFGLKHEISNIVFY